MKKILYAAMLLLGLGIVGCQKTELKPEPQPQPTPEPKQQEFTATIPNTVTKTTVTEDGKVSWVSTDAIGIFDEGKSAPVKATIKSVSNDGKTAIFTPASEITKAVGAIYPYDANATLSSNVVSISLGANQSGAFSDANVAASKANGYNLSFKNATSVFKFKVTDTNAKSAKLSGTGIAGTLQITLGDNITSTIVSEGVTDEITISNITPDTDYYVTIAPKAYDDFKFAWYDNTGAELGSTSLGKNVTIGSGELYEWGDLVEHTNTEYVKFKDAIFKAYCVENFDADMDGEISLDEALVVTDIWVVSNDISSLEGIGYFKNLKYLTCYFLYSSCTEEEVVKHRYYVDGIACLGYSKVKHYYDGEGNEISSKLTSLDVSNNTALTQLTCYDNKLTSLDASGCTALTTLSCNNNQLTSLVVSGCTALTTLSCNNNQLASLDVSGCTALTGVDCKDNQLTSLNVSGCTALKYFYCDLNNFTSLDVSGCAALTTLNCDCNQLTSLNVSGCAALTSLDCNLNQLTSLDVSKNTALTSLNCMVNTKLTSLDVSNNIALIYLSCQGDNITNLDLSKNTALIGLNCSENDITNLDVSGCTTLTSLDCDYNKLTSLDVSKNTALTSLDCRGNNISTIFVWKGFDSSSHPYFYKDDTSAYVEVGGSVSNIDNYTVKSIWN